MNNTKTIIWIYHVNFTKKELLAFPFVQSTQNDYTSFLNNVVNITKMSAICRKSIQMTNWNSNTQTINTFQGPDTFLQKYTKYGFTILNK